MKIGTQATRWTAICGVFFGSCLCYTSCKQTTPDPLSDLSTEQVAVVQALNKVIVPLQGADPTRDFSDLAPLDTIFAKARVVGMGEGTHGTREFFRMKDRLFRYLVQKHGHQAIAFEANFGRSVLTNRFIHGQITNLNSAAAAAKSMYFWTWSTDEVRELLQWMKDYNIGKATGQQISFYGFDCQYADDEFPLIREFSAKADYASIGRVDSLFTEYNLVGKLLATAPLRQEYRQHLTIVYTSFVQNEVKWVASGGRQDYEIARQAVRILIQKQELGDVGSCDASTKRDQFMAENVQWLLTRMNVGKLSLWAHNYHIANVPYATCNLPSMGTYLKRQLNDNYLIIGTSLTNGSFTVVDASQNNRGLTALSIRTEGIKSSFNYLLRKAQYTNFALNLNQSPLDSTLSNWLGKKHPLFEAGAGFNESKPEPYHSVTPLTGRYDVLIHFRDTSPTQLLP